MSGEEKFAWVVASIVFVVVFIVWFIFSFFSHSVFVWPPRFDVVACWNQQVEPAKDKAVNAAANFVP